MAKFTKHENIIIRDVKVQGGLVSCRIETTPGIKRFFNTDYFFIDYQQDMTSVPISILSCPFVANFLALAWVTDATIWVDEIDKTFYRCLSRVREAYQDMYGKYPLKGRIVPSKIIANVVDGNKSILLFSGGADCHASFIRNINKSMILCNIQGWFKRLEDKDPVAEADYKDIDRFANTFQLPFQYVRSNFAQVVNAREFDKRYQTKLGDSLWHGFLHPMAFISIAMPLGWLLKAPEIIIASSLTVGLNYLCASTSTTDSEFEFATNGIVLHDGFELDRQGKLHTIADFQKKLGRPYEIRVCSFNDHNCCECEKCFRTVLSLVAENVSPADFGFFHNGTLKQHWQDVLNKRIAMMGFVSESVVHWPYIKNVCAKIMTRWMLKSANL